MAPHASKDELLARVNFPPYVVRMLTNRHVLVAGGGGKAKTGISNAIKIYELTFDGRRCRARSSSHYETGDSAIMNCVTFHNGKYFVLAAGLDEYCQLYQITFKVTQPEEDDEENESDNVVENCTNELRKRNKNEGKDVDGSETIENLNRPRIKDLKSKKDKNRNSDSTLIGFNVQPFQSIQTDFAKDEPFQKVVRTSWDHKFMVTGGADGCLRIWKMPNLEEIGCIKAHENEIDDIDISPTNKQIVSISRDGHGYVWKYAEKELCCELIWTPAGDEKYRFRNCRFGIVEGDKVNACLYTSHIPVTRKKKPAPSYLIKWETLNYSPKKIQATGPDVHSSMAMSDDGRFIGIGTMSGNVHVYIAFSLQHLLRCEASHSFFVTSVEFVLSSKEMPEITGDYDASLISVSVDNQIKIHHIPKQVTVSVFWVLMVFMGCLLFVFSLMNYFEL